MKALHIDPWKRYQWVKEIQKEIEAYQTGFATRAEGAGLARQLALMVRRHKTLTVSVAIILVLVVSGAVVSTSLWLAAEKAKTTAMAESKRAQTNFAALKDTAPVLAAQAQTLLEKGNTDQALNAISYAIQLAPENADYLYRKGNILQTSLRLAEAAAAYDDAVKKQPNHEAARKNSALCRELMQEQKGAKRFPYSALCRLYQALREQERYAEARAVIQRVTGGAGKDIEDYVKKQLIDGGMRAKIYVTVGADGTCALGLYSLDRGAVSDLAPLRHLGIPLNSLQMDASAGGKVYSLDALQGMPLTSLDLTAMDVPDLSPLQGMKLKVFAVTGVYTDLSPLVGMPLREVRVGSARVSDLSPLKGMELSKLDIVGTAVKDLEPIRGMLSLRTLMMRGIPVRDLGVVSSLKNLWCLEIGSDAFDGELSHLKGLPLTNLTISMAPNVKDISIVKGLRMDCLKLTGCDGITDLSPLQELGGSCRYIWLEGRGISDLSPLKGMRISELYLRCPGVTDYSVLRTVTANALNIGCPELTDLSSLRGLSITTIYIIARNVTKGIEVLREMKSLKQIYPFGFTTVCISPEQFWKEYDEGKYR
jgi:tetratricopeptide (TPR) repeat protein